MSIIDLVNFLIFTWIKLRTTTLIVREEILNKIFPYILFTSKAYYLLL